MEGYEVGSTAGYHEVSLIVEPRIYSGQAITWYDQLKVTIIRGGTETSYIADISSYNNYYPFGMQQPGRGFSSGEYRYGFNGKELDVDGMGGGGSTYDYGFRIYNPQIAKFLSVDPLAPNYPFKSTYDFAENQPIWASDLDGLEKNIEIAKAVKDAHGSMVTAVGYYDLYTSEIPTWKWARETAMNKLKQSGKYNDIVEKLESNFYVGGDLAIELDENENLISASYTN